MIYSKRKIEKIKIKTTKEIKIERERDRGGLKLGTEEIENERKIYFS